MEDVIFRQVIDNFDFAYIIVTNLFIYFLIKLADIVNGNKKVPLLHKRVLTLVGIIVMFVAYYFSNYGNVIVLINSSIAAPVTWSWVLKPLFNKLKMSYKK